MAKGHERDEAEVLADQYMADQDPNKPIAQSTANDILRRHLRKYFQFELRRDGMSAERCA